VDGGCAVSFDIPFISNHEAGLPIYQEISIETGCAYPKSITFGVSAHGGNLRPFTFPKIVEGHVEGKIKDKKNYLEKVDRISIMP
jgi:hypothetical protein